MNRENRKDGEIHNSTVRGFRTSHGLSLPFYGIRKIGSAPFGKFLPVKGVAKENGKVVGVEIKAWFGPVKLLDPEFIQYKLLRKKPKGLL